MTDAAFAAAPAAPAPSAVPIDTSAPHIPNPAETSNIGPQGDQATQGQPPKGEERRSLDDIIKASHEKVTKQAEGKDKPEAPKPVADTKAAKPEAQRQAPVKGPDGKFQSPKPAEAAPAAQQAPQPPAQGQHAEAPSRFSQDAKAAWQAAPEPVRAEVHRMQRELEAGLQKYRPAAEAYESVKDFDAYAKQHGSNLRAVLANYATLERSLVTGDEATKDMALQKVFQRAGIDPRQWAAKVLNQPPEARDAEQHQTITSLRSEIASLKQAVQGVTSHVQQQQQTALTDNVTAFAKSNPRFDELSDGSLEYSIQNILRSNLVPQGLSAPERLQKAYELADRLNPGSAASRAPLNPEPARPPNGAGLKSIAGPPATGSDPTIPAKKKGERPSIDDALRRAAARVAS